MILLDPSIVTASVATLVAIAGILGGVAAIINWLRDKFIEVEKQLSHILDEHEEKDQHRHEDNIQRLSALEAQLIHVIKLESNGKHH